MTFHIFHINAAHSGADGTVQFTELMGDADRQHAWTDHSIMFTDGRNATADTVAGDLPTAAIHDKTALAATQGLADLGLLARDHIIPNDFLSINSGTVNFADINGGALTYSQFPDDGALSLNDDDSTDIDSRVDFASDTAAITFNNVIAGTDNAEELMGTEGADVFEAGAGNDRLNGQEGDDSFDGGVGVDTAIFSSAFDRYSTSRSLSTFSISGPDGRDTLSDVERLQFADRNIAIDLEAGQSGNNTVRLIGAAFDAVTIQTHPDYVGIGLKLFDVGQTMFDVAQLALSAMGTLTNEAFVDRVYLNVVGTAPVQAERDFYVGLLEGSGGAFSQAQLLEFAASSEINAANIDLVGLQQSGVTFNPGV